MRMHDYFVSYMYKSIHGQTVFDNVSTVHLGKIQSMGDIKRLEKYLKSKNDDIESLVIINFIEW